MLISNRIPNMAARLGALRRLTMRHDGRLSTVITLTSDALLEAGTAMRARQLITVQMQHLPAGTTGTLCWHLSLPPIGPIGFPIDLTGNGDCIRGCFGGLEEDFDSQDAALIWVQRALSSAYQLRTTFINGEPRVWRLEPVADHTSIHVLECGYPTFFRSRRSSLMLIRRNAMTPD